MDTRMTKRLFFLLAAIACSADPAAETQASAPNSGAWSGTIVYSSCNADEAFNESPECFRAAPGAKLSLYDDTNRVMYGLEPQERVTAHPGDSVTVRGILEEDDAIHINSLQIISIRL